MHKCAPVDLSVVVGGQGSPLAGEAPDVSHEDERHLLVFLCTGSHVSKGRVCLLQGRNRIICDGLSPPHRQRTICTCIFVSVSLYLHLANGPLDIGGFGQNLDHEPCLLGTLSAIQILIIYDSLHLIDTDLTHSCKRAFKGDLLNMRKAT